MAEEHNKRLAQTRMPDGTIIERPWTPGERYQLYRRGFQDGAGGRGARPEREGLGAYDRGYAEGRDAVGAAVSAYAKEIGYEPSILRDTSEPEPKPDDKRICPSCGQPWERCEMLRSCIE